MKKTPEDSLVPKPEKIQDWIDFADSPVLRGIGGVKAPGSTALVSPEQAAFYAREIKKCKEDPVYFAEKYFTIVSFKGKEKIKLFEKQKDMLRSFIDSPFTIVLSARQSGKCVDGSTIVTIRDKKTKKCRTIKIESLFRKIGSQQPS